jgi:hypothetical protein
MVTSRVGNPFFFTGRRLDVIDKKDAGTPHHFADDYAGLQLLAYTKTFNAAQLPHEHLAGNSNWALKCLIGHCGLTIDWGGWGKPTAVDNPPCKTYKNDVYVPGPGISFCGRRCVEWYTCP